MKKPLVSIIIPHWNGVELLRTCLPSLKNQSFKMFEVLIVDNGSTDNSISFVKNFYPEVKLIKLKKNSGFAKAVNQGITKALGEYLFLLNNDTELDINCLEHLLMAAENHPEVGFITAKVLNYFKRNLIDTTGDLIDAVGHLHSRAFNKKDLLKHNKADYLFAASGGSTLFRRNFFSKVGLFDEEYFLYMEDADLCLRAQLLGFKGWYEPKAVIYHRRMATSSKNMAFVECECFKNMAMTIIKNFPTALLLHNFNWLKILLVHFHTICHLSKKGYFLGVLKAEWYLLSHFGVLLAKRKKIQSNKIVSDHYIIENIQGRDW